MKRKKQQRSFIHNSCPAGHGHMFWMEEPEKYFCSHQLHDMDDSKRWFTADEVVAANTAKGGK